MILLFMTLLFFNPINGAWIPNSLASYFYSVEIDHDDFAEREEKTYQFEFQENGILEIDHCVGDVYIAAGPSDSLTIKSIRRAEPNHLDDLKTEINADKHKVSLTTKPQTTIIRATICYQITAPPSTTIIKNTVSMGRTSIENIEGRINTSARDGIHITRALGLIKACSSMGKVSISNSSGIILADGRDGVFISNFPSVNVPSPIAEGPIQARSSMGKVEIINAQGSIEKADGRDGVRINNAQASVNAFSSMGTVFVSGMNSINASGRDGVTIKHLPNAQGPIQAHSSMGEVEITDAQGPIKKSNGRDGVTIVNPQDNVTATSSMGAIKLQLNDSINAQIEAETSMGTIKSDIPITFTEHTEKKIKGIIGSAQQKLRSISLRARDTIRISQKR